MKKTINLKEKATKLLDNVFMGKNGEILSMKEIHNGYTNFSYLVTFANGKKYQVRFPHRSDLINRANEFQILSIVGDQSFVYFDTKTGIGVKEWIDGKNPRIPPWWKKWSKIDDLFAIIKKIHKIQLPVGNKFKKLNFDAYNENLYRLKLVYQTKFLSLIDLYRDEPLVTSHTDINAENIVLDKKGKLHIIDYEWCGLASEYWDYANFIREAKIRFNNIEWKKYIDNFEMKKLKDFIFICSVFAYLWTWLMPETKRLKKYRKRTIRQIHWYYRGLDNEK